MTYYKDLDQLDYFGPIEAPYLRAVGWLEKSHPYEIGPVSDEVLQRLAEILRAGTGLFNCLGAHCCDLCTRDGAVGVDNLWVPGNGFLYVMPELALHYIVEHSYRPPEEFLAAVMGAPWPGSDAFRDAILANGERAIFEMHRKRD